MRPGAHADAQIPHAVGYVAGTALAPTAGMDGQGVLMPSRNTVPDLVRVEGAGGLDTDDALAAFDSEADWPKEAPVRAPQSEGAVDVPTGSVATQPQAQSNRHRLYNKWVVWTLALVAAAQTPFVAMWVGSQTAPPPTHGTVWVETEPSGAEIRVNGKAGGRTPARLSIPRGAAAIELRRAGRVKIVPLAITAKETVRLRVELAADIGRAAATPRGIVRVPTERSNASPALDLAVDHTMPAMTFDAFASSERGAAVSSRP